MALSSSSVDHFTLMFYSVTTLALLTKIASTAITTYVATSFLIDGPISGLAITASSIEIFAVLCLTMTIALYLRRVSSGLMLLVWICSTAACLAGTILSLVTLGLTDHRLDQGIFLDDHANVSIGALAEAGLIVGALSLVPQAAFFASTCPSRRKDNMAVAEYRQEASPSRSTKRHSLSAQLAALVPGSPRRAESLYSEQTSPSLSVFQFSSGLPLRDSAGFVLRPMTSKTRLILGQSFTSRDSKSIHSTDRPAEPWRNTDDFESWDTSSVENNFEQQFSLLKQKSKPTRLETIPGSRPVSPAHPLNGPFQGEQQLEPEQMPLPESPVQSHAGCTSPVSETGSIRSFHRPSTRRQEGSSQAHIHPLFRSESPVPPPLASPATVITASPYAGQVVSPDGALGSRVLHSAHSSRPASPMMSPVRSRAGSMRSFRQVTSPTPPVEPFERSCSQLSLSHRPQPDD